MKKNKKTYIEKAFVFKEKTFADFEREIEVKLRENIPIEKLFPETTK